MSATSFTKTIEKRFVARLKKNDFYFIAFLFDQRKNPLIFFRKLFSRKSITKATLLISGEL